MDDATATVIAAGLAAGGAAIVAKLSRPDSAAPEPHDLTTIAGLAAALTETRAQQARQDAEHARQIAALQVRQQEHEDHARVQDRTIQALRRWAAALEGALRSTGATMPEPIPEDAPLIRGG